MRPRRRSRLPREARHDLAHAAVVDVDEPEPVGRLIQHAARIARPRRRVGEVGGQPARRADRRAVARDRKRGRCPSMIAAIWRAVRRPHRARSPRACRSTCAARDRTSDPVRRIAAGVRWGRVDRHAAAPGSCPRGTSSSTAAAPTSRPRGRRATSSDAPARSADRATWRPSRLLHVHDLQLRLRIEKRDARAVRRPRRRHRAAAPACDRGRSAGRESTDPSTRRDPTRTRARCRPATTPGSVSTNASWVRRCGGSPPPAETDPEIAERGKHHARSVRRDRRVHHARAPAAALRGGKRAALRA